MIEDKIKYNDYWERVQEQDKEIERLNNIIKEVREYINDWNMNWYATGSEEDHQRLNELIDHLKILDKGDQE